MIQHRFINQITCLGICFALLVTIGLCMYGGKALSTDTSSTAYTEMLFHNDIITVDILADEATWKAILASAPDETYTMVNVVVNGVQFDCVGIRPKGNSSLTQILQDTTTDRYSFKLKFDEYITDQSCFGLDSFVINNIISDATYMKEYLSYELMAAAGVVTPLYGYSDIRVNGETWGLYLLIECYDDSFLNRTFQSTQGELYNVKSVGMGMGRNSDGGGSLQYTDDEVSSYPSIFENAVSKMTEQDAKRVIAALQALDENEDISSYFDVDAILRYFAAHTVLVNLDSYYSTMAQNYYLYEKDGIVQVLPWDYNLSFGGFQSASTSSVINFPIDTPVSGVSMEERPLLSRLLSNEEYLQTYHTYLQSLVTTYFYSGVWSAGIERISAQIDSYVKNDPTAFYTHEQYTKGVETLEKIGLLRAESIQLQLDGVIPSSSDKQAETPQALVADGGLKLSDMGSQGGGKDGGMQGNPSDGANGTMPQRPGLEEGDTMTNPDRNPEENMPSQESNTAMREAMQLWRDNNQVMTDALKEQMLALGLSEEDIASLQSMNGMLVGGGAPGTPNAPTAGTSNNDTLWIIGVLCMILLGGVVFAKNYHRRY